MRSGSSARGRRARASLRASGARALRAHKASGLWAAGSRSAGERARRSAFSATAPQELEQLGRGDPGRAPRYVSHRTPRPNLAYLGPPRGHLGAGGSGPGAISARLSFPEAAGRARGDPPPPPHSTGAWTAARSPLPRLPTPGLCAPSLGVPLADRGLSVFGGGLLKPLSESGCQWGTRRIDDKVLCSLIAAPNL